MNSPGESPAVYLHDLAAAGVLRRERPPGNLVFTWALG